MSAERNARVQARYDALMREGKHGHYETLFRVVKEEVEAERSRAEKAEARADLLMKQLAKSILHGQECQNDIYARDVCEGMYLDRTEDIIGLVEGLRAVLALVGEDAQIRTIIEQTIREHGGCDG